MNDHQHFTESCDAIRALAGTQEDGLSTKLSRADAIQIRRFIADAIGMDNEELSKLIAKHQKDIDNF